MLTVVELTMLNVLLFASSSVRQCEMFLPSLFFSQGVTEVYAPLNSFCHVRTISVIRCDFFLIEGDYDDSTKK